MAWVFFVMTWVIRVQISGWVMKTNVWNQRKQPSDEKMCKFLGLFWMLQERACVFFKTVSELPLVNIYYFIYKTF